MLFLQGSGGRGETMDAQTRPQTPEDDCPICYGELGNPEPLCPNGHKICDVCRPHILRVDGWVGPRCPICRAPLQREAGPRPPPLPHGEGVDLALVYEARQQHQQWVAQNAPNRVPNRRGQGGARPHRGPEWDAARQRFLEHREAGRIPAHSTFGGIHMRKCGHRNCERLGGAMGVRFLLFGETGKRRYRCEEHTQG